ncbi:MAG TPA: oxidoreductase [Dehalococcoidia bacterium]|nr:oxidoreductase [Dehalococcoidia bacterium]
MAKLKIALYWAASCGGCEIAQLQIGDKILKLAEAADIVFWPVAIDVKYSDVEKMPDKSVDVCLFNGAVRTSENEHLAHLLRAKSKIMIAYGSCAVEGCIPGLANFFNRQMILDRAYIETPTTDNPKKIYPQTKVKVPEGELDIPEFYDTVKTLAQTVDVDYFVPGCPPEEKTTWLALEALIKGDLPPKGTTISHSTRALCYECPRIREEKKIKKFYRPYEIIPDPEKCLLEQGLLCYGVATRGGCGALCPQANMPCTGCYGPVEGVVDQGAHFLSALASVIDSNDPEEITRIINDIPNPASIFYRYSLADSFVKRARIK